VPVEPDRFDPGGIDVDVAASSGVQVQRRRPTVETADLVVIGAGAAGLKTAIVCARHAPRLRVVCLDGARSIGAKILVSGGGRCNVTNRVVAEGDFWGGSSRTVRRVLRAFPAPRAVEFFEGLGVSLHEEEDGKLFPDTNRARTVLDALLADMRRLGIDLRTSHRVLDVVRDGAGLVVATAQHTWRPRAVVFATGGQSLPKSGSDGFGYELARRLGHGHVAATPALVPLLLGEGPYRALAGVSHAASVRVRADGGQPVRLTGSLLWTHFGVSGPLILNASRHWHRAVEEGRPVDLVLNVCPDHTFDTLDRWLLDAARERPRAGVGSTLRALLPASVAEAWTTGAAVDPQTPLAHLSREDRHRLLIALLDTRLDVCGSRGYSYAEVTAGGVPLDEIDPATMESRVCPGLYLVGEILDVDGRIGGFNFQWAWSTGYIAGTAISRTLDGSGNTPEMRG
jgi:predicted Rossmann fold flavoprotein